MRVMCVCACAQDVDGDDIRIEEFDGPLPEWIAQAKVEQQVKKRFARFLNNFQVGETAKVYPRRMNDLCASAFPLARSFAVWPWVFVLHPRTPLSRPLNALPPCR
jgi:hypothetical protein